MPTPGTAPALSGVRRHAWGRPLCLTWMRAVQITRFGPEVLEVVDIAEPETR
jgi:hypothetical protein